MTAPLPISLDVNGERVDAYVLPRLNLADFLREQLQLTGTHVGCEHGVCGACTVRVNGEIVRSCLMLAVQVHGASVQTIEGLSDSGEVADLQAAFRDRNALQCGYCTPGMLMAAQDLLKQQAEPDRAADTRASFRQLLPLHRLPGHYRRGRDHGAHAHGAPVMIVTSANSETLSELDRPNSYIGKVVPRPNLERLMQGRGLYVSDIELPRMAHVAFLRSPHAHAKIMGIDATEARRLPGVIAVVTGEELAAVITPWVGVLSHLKGLKSAPQHAIAIDRVCWQGEAVAAVVATSRAVAEDAAEIVRVEYEELDAVTDMRTALDPETPVIHASLGDNLAFERNLDAGAVDAAFADSDAVVEADFIFGRHTGVTLEPRSVVADWNAAEERLTIYQGTQAPHMVQNIAALHLGLEEAQVRVVCKDVGGSFGIKVHIYADEMATYALSKLLRRPIKFVADRVESFNTDIHARDHRCKGRIGVKRDGTIMAFEIDDLTGIGPYSMYPRTSAIEANQVVNLVGGPYVTKNYRARARVVFQNKNVMCQYRAVGHPIACSVTEGLVDLAAAKIGMDPVEIRRRNLIADDAYPCASPSGLRFELLSHHAAMNRLMKMMDYDGAARRAGGLAKQEHSSRHRHCEFY